MGTNAANAANMKAILASVGVEADDKQLEIVIQKFGNKNIEKVIAEGSAYLAAMGGGGGGAVAASGAAPAGGAGDAPKAEEKKEEKKEALFPIQSVVSSTWMIISFVSPF